MDLLLKHDFGHLWNTVLLRYADLSNIGSYYCTVLWKITFVNITTSVIIKLCKYREVFKLLLLNTCFPQIYISLKAQRLTSQLKQWDMTEPDSSWFPLRNLFLPFFFFSSLSPGHCLLGTTHAPEGWPPASLSEGWPNREGTREKKRSRPDEREAILPLCRFSWHFNAAEAGMTWENLPISFLLRNFIIFFSPLSGIELFFNV